MTSHVVTKPETSRATSTRWGQLVASVLVIFGLVGCAGQSPSETPPSEQGAGSESVGGEADHPTDDESHEPAIFTIAGVGDVLTHDNILEAAEMLAEGQSGQAYDFTPLMTEVEEWVVGADLALCGLEVPIVSPGQEPSGYPVFAAPEQLVDGLAETGFDGCSTANNHAMDAGTKGVERTLEVFDKHGLGHVGTARTEEEAREAQFYTLTRGDTELQVAHLATTQVHNIAPPTEASWMVTDETAPEMTDRAAQAREEGADIVVVSVHWGVEFAHEPDAVQRAYGDTLAEGGEIDLVLGSHPHTPQAVEHLEGGPHDDGMWVAWSMGNFLTNQDTGCCVMETATGTIVYATVEVAEGQAARVTDIEWTPVTVDRSESEHRGIWPLAELIDADELPPEIELDPETVQARWDRVLEVVGEQHLRTAPSEPSEEEPVVTSRER